MRRIKLILGTWVLIFTSLASFSGHSALITGNPLYTDSSGSTWLDLNDAGGFGWTDIASQCSPITGECSGILDGSLSARGYVNDLDLTGLFWASSAEVIDLWDEIAGVGPGTYPDGTGEPFTNIFSPTYSNFSVAIFDGLTRDLQGNLGGRAILSDRKLGGDDVFRVENSIPIDWQIAELGAYLYRPVPVPAAIWLFGTALIGLIGFSKRRKSA